MHKILIFLLVIFSVMAHSMNVEPSGLGDGYVLILKGKIEKNDLNRVKKIIKDKGYPELTFITSSGGDVEEALQIGKYFNKAFIEINTIDQCDSACFFLWAGAYKRETIVSFGLHRPYFDKSYFSGLSADQAKKKYKTLSKMVRDYLLEMHVPVSFIDTMMSIDSENIWYVHEEQLLGKISKYAPAQREWILSKCGALSRDENRDFDASQNNKIYQYLLNEQKYDIEVISYLKNDAEYAKNLPSGYLSYLKNKWRKIRKCESQAIVQARKSIEK
tara:strand:+ start:108 stop:929 length:822 start_codon:yes stop_codon:yes gene_type:complete